MAPISLNATQLEAESNKFHTLFEGGESEETWLKLDNALARMADITSGSWELASFQSTVRQKWKLGIMLCLNSDRTKLVKDCLVLIETLGTCLKDRFDESYLVPILKLCGKANKIIVNYASSTLIHCIHVANGFPALIPHLADAHKNPSKTYRLAAIDCLVATVECCSKAKLEHYIEKMESGICVFIVDSVPQVRESARMLYSAYQEKFCTDRLLISLPETSKKYLKLENIQSSNWKTPKRDYASHELQSKPNSGSKTSVPKSFTSPETHVSTEKSQPALSLFLKNQSQGDIGSTRLATLFSKGTLKDNISKKPGEIRETFLGGAMRVVREPVSVSTSNETLSRPTVKALRVPAPPVAIADVSLRPSANIVADVVAKVSDAGEKKAMPKRKVVVPEFVKSKKQEVAPDISTLFSRTKSTDWQVRCKAFESLWHLIRCKDFKISTKMVDTVVSGLEDTHFRVVNCVFDVISALVEGNHQVEAFFIKTVTAVYNGHNAKSRQATFEQSEMLLHKMLESMKETAVPMLMNLIADPGLMRKPKAKNGLLSLFCAVRLEFISSFISKPSNYKNLLLRLLSHSQDIDDKTQGSMRDMIKSMYLSNQESFWSIWNVLKPSDQNLINKLFGKNVSIHRELLGETIKSPVLESHSTLNSPHSRIPIIHASPFSSRSSQLQTSVPIEISNESLNTTMPHLDTDRATELSEQTLKEAEDSSEDDLSSKNISHSAEFSKVELIDGNNSSCDSVEDSQETESQHENTDMSNSFNLRDNVLCNQASKHEDGAELISEFLNDILDRIVQTSEPEDSNILLYVNQILEEILAELQEETSKKGKIQENNSNTLINPILEAAPAAESLTKWYIPSEPQNCIVENNSVLVEPWYVPSWTTVSCTTSKEEELHKCFILLESLLETYDSDNYCSEILSALLENRTPLSLPDLDIKESILSKFPQYFSSNILFPNVEKSCQISLRVGLSILNDLLSINSNASTLFHEHSDWRSFLMEGLLSNRSATRQISIKLFQQVLNFMDNDESESLWHQLESCSKSKSHVKLIQSMLK